jgi:hypothetical protein
VIQFDTDKKPLTFLLDQIENRVLALPDFQRSFVWDAEATRQLVVSIVSSFPAGSLLLMQGGGDIFAPRAFEEAPDLNGMPAYMVLDGQQRLTSLFQAFMGRGTHRYFVNMQELLDGYELDEAVEVFTTRRARRWESLTGQARDLMLPLWRIRQFAWWRDEVLELLGESELDVKKLKAQFNDLEHAYVKPVDLYQFPVTTLSHTTPVEAVCTIFETLNRTGVKLSVFELLTARAYAHDLRLRDLWDTGRAKYPIIEEFGVDPYYVLQAIAVFVSKSAKRSAVLKLPVPDIGDNWDWAVRSLASALTMLRDECGVLVPKWLPYNTMLVTMAAAWPVVESAKGPAQGARRDRIRRWFWCSAFSQAYENSPNSRTEADVPALNDWLQGGQEPGVVADFSFDPVLWREVSGRQRALYRATVALMMSRNPLDFHKGHRLTPAIIVGEEIDDHHVFPRKQLKKMKRDQVVDSVLNHTLIDKLTNIRIGGNAPSKYLGDMEAELGPTKVRSILRSHELPPDHDGPLLQDRFEDFLAWREHQLARRLREATSA